MECLKRGGVEDTAVVGPGATGARHIQNTTISNVGTPVVCLFVFLFFYYAILYRSFAAGNITEDPAIYRFRPSPQQPTCSSAFRSPLADGARFLASICLLDLSTA